MYLSQMRPLFTCSKSMRCLTSTLKLSVNTHMVGNMYALKATSFYHTLRIKPHPNKLGVEVSLQ